MSEQVHKRVSASFQALAFIISLCLISAVFGIRYNMFISHDPTPILEPNAPSSKEIQVGMHVTNLSQFNITQNKFDVDGTVWFSYNPREISLDAIKKFSIFNGTTSYVSDPIMHVFNDTHHITQFRIQAEFHTPLNYRMFPFDDHRVTFKITNDFLPNNVIFTTKDRNLTFDSSLYIPGWRIIKTTFEAGMKRIELEQNNEQFGDTRQEAILSLFCERSDPGIMINILLTLLIMLFISMLTFSSTEDTVLVVTVSLVALIGYRAILQSMTPSHVSYFMYSDFLYLLTLIGVITALFTDIATRAGKWDRGKIKRLCIAGIYSFFIISCTTIMLIR